MDNKNITLLSEMKAFPIVDLVHQHILQILPTILTLATLVACELLYRILVVSNEYIVNWKHYKSKHRLREVLNYALLKNDIRTYTAVPLLVLFLILECDKSGWDYFVNNVYITSIPYIIFRFLHCTYNNVELAKFIRVGNGIDYGTGMAFNYFHGYLHLQLPETGHRTKGMKFRIEEYEDTEGVYFPVKKFFILIPQSMYAKPKIESTVMERVKDLETVYLDRAGVKRPFKNAVYRISGCGPDKSQSWYATLEYATPIMSFYEGLTSRWTSTNEMQDMQREISLQFYCALKRITTECPDTKGLVELIYFNDITPDGREIDVGEIVRRRILTLIEKNNEMLSYS